MNKNSPNFRLTIIKNSPNFNFKKEKEKKRKHALAATCDISCDIWFNMHVPRGLCSIFVLVLVCVYMKRPTDKLKFTMNR